MPDSGWRRRVPALRTIWGLGIAGVMLIAVAPYPVRGVWDSSEIIHRIHNTVGSVQYLTLWAVPVLVWTLGRRDLSAWRLALASSLSIAVTSLWTGDLLGSGGWLPLCTLLVLWPTHPSWTTWLLRVDRVALAPLAASALLWWVALAESPSYLHFQQVSGSDVHGLRYHYGGMAAASLAMAGGATVVALWRSSRTTVMVVAGSAVAAGVAHLLWSNYDSALPASYAVFTIAAGALVAPLAFWEWPALQISSRVAARSPSSSSPQRPTTPS